jgi:hypothetical protein
VHTVSALVFDRLDRHTPPSHNADGAPRGRSDDHWVRKGVMGPGKCENVCKSQSVLVMINTCGIPHPRPTGAYTDDRHVCATCTQRRRRRRRRHSLRPRAPSGRVRGSSLSRSRPPPPPTGPGARRVRSADAPREMVGSGFETRILPAGSATTWPSEPLGRGLRLCIGKAQPH